MPRDARNIGASVRVRLLQRSRAENSDYQILLTRYALERLLYRLSLALHQPCAAWGTTQATRMAVDR